MSSRCTAVLELVLTFSMSVCRITYALVSVPSLSGSPALFRFRVLCVILGLENRATLLPGSSATPPPRKLSTPSSRPTLPPSPVTRINTPSPVHAPVTLLFANHMFVPASALTAPTLLIVSSELLGRAFKLFHSSQFSFPGRRLCLLVPLFSGSPCVENSRHLSLSLSPSIYLDFFLLSLVACLCKYCPSLSLHSRHSFFLCSARHSLSFFPLLSSCYISGFLSPSLWSLSNLFFLVDLISPP